MQDHNADMRLQITRLTQAVCCSARALPPTALATSGRALAEVAAGALTDANAAVRDAAVGVLHALRERTRDMPALASFMTDLRARFPKVAVALDAPAPALSTTGAVAPAPPAAARPSTGKAASATLPKAKSGGGGGSSGGGGAAAAPAADDSNVGEALPPVDVALEGLGAAGFDLAGLDSAKWQDKKACIDAMTEKLRALVPAEVGRLADYVVVCLAAKSKQLRDSNPNTMIAITEVRGSLAWRVCASVRRGRA